MKIEINGPIKGKALVEMTDKSQFKISCADCGCTDPGLSIMAEDGGMSIKYKCKHCPSWSENFIPMDLSQTRKP